MATSPIVLRTVCRAARFPSRWLCHTSWHGLALPSRSDADDRWAAGLRGDRPRRLPRVRAPDRPRACSRSTGWCRASGPDRPELDRDPRTRLGARAAVPRDAECGRPPGHEPRCSRTTWTRDRGERYRDAAASNPEAIERGDDVIFQACFFDGTWLGFADFLLRVDRPGRRRSAGRTRSPTRSSRGASRRRRCSRCASTTSC